jgi:hypothetical protein
MVRWVEVELDEVADVCKYCVWFVHEVATTANVYCVSRRRHRCGSWCGNGEDCGQHDSQRVKEYDYGGDSKEMNHWRRALNLFTTWWGKGRWKTVCQGGRANADSTWSSCTASSCTYLIFSHGELLSVRTAREKHGVTAVNTVRHNSLRLSVRTFPSNFSNLQLHTHFEGSAAIALAPSASAPALALAIVA